ncbi:hypothetical protein UFOVP46_69 [uncultured Caudovirales phage]|uniref:Uncharacterized protein n=1 Tax=uncultured Caudovirales phage TaxID=2100421 RepID=A0A6J5KP81_9CAUD|nr:hypothetical protein UFOVP46_69 [uncultured Caudovirales phage]
MANRKQENDAAVAENVRPLDAPSKNSAPKGGTGMTPEETVIARKRADLEAANAYRTGVKRESARPVNPDGTAGERPSGEVLAERARVRPEAPTRNPRLGVRSAAQEKLANVLAEAKTAPRKKPALRVESDLGPRYGNPHKKADRK